MNKQTSNFDISQLFHPSNFTIVAIIKNLYIKFFKIGSTRSAAKFSNLFKIYRKKKKKI